MKTPRLYPDIVPDVLLHEEICYNTNEMEKMKGSFTFRHCWFRTVAVACLPSRVRRVSMLALLKTIPSIAGHPVQSVCRRLHLHPRSKT